MEINKHTIMGHKWTYVLNERKWVQICDGHSVLVNKRVMCPPSDIVQITGVISDYLGLV